MSDPVPRTTSPANSPDDRLDSWKEIAAYLNRDVTTVQRWEKREGMPVHRHLHDRQGSVYASRAELDAWARRRSLRAAPESESTSPGPGVSDADAPPRRTKMVWLVLAAAGALALGAAAWLQSREYFWRSPIADARFEGLTDFDGVAEAAAISRDGHFVAFLSDRDGAMDVWVTQVGSGQFHNLTHGTAPELVNPSVRTVGFSPDGALVTFWTRKPKGPGGGGDISIWAVPTLGGEPRPYLEGVAEFDWSRDGTRLAYHTTGPGDPTFVSEGGVRSGERPIFTAPEGLHAHFPLWSRDSRFLYFVQGALPDKLDIWRIAPSGGNTERITSQKAQVSHPVLIDSHTLLYLASDPDGSGPWLYSIDVNRKIAHRLGSGLDRYTSLAASADGRRLAVTLASPRSTLWRLPLDGSAKTTPEPLPLTSKTASSPRLGPGYVLYVARSGATEIISKFETGKNSELWSAPETQMIGDPAISRDGQHVAFSVRQQGKTVLYAMDRDGANARIVTDALDLKGAPSWAADGQSIFSGADDHGVVHLFRIALDGSSPKAFLQEYSVDPNWSPDGSYAVYSGPDIGTNFKMKAVTADGAAHPLPDLVLTRGARHVTFLPGGRELVFLRGEIQHKDVWALDLETGSERQLTQVAPDFNIRDFDVSPDGRELILQRVQEHSNVVLVERGQQ